MAAQPGSANASRGAGRPNPGEVSAFKARLKKLPLEILREKLGGPALGLKWQRELAEAEMDDREPEVDEEAPPAIIVRRRSVPLWGRWLAALLIAGSSAVLLYTAYELWMM
jgi:hypothetical protein